MRAAALLLFLALTACSPEIIYMYPEPEPVGVVEAAPVWQPESWHIYVLDSADAILVDELAQPESTYRIRYTCWALTVEQHNILDDPAHPWRVVGGGMKEGV